MKNIIIAILVAIILVLGFLFFTQKKSNVNYEPWPETEPATVKPTTNYPIQNNPTTNTNNNSSQQEDHEYENLAGGFYVDMSGRVISESTIAGHRIFFDKPNRGINEPRDFYVRYFSATEWQQYWSSRSTTYDYAGTVTYNGITFQHYTREAVDPGIDDPKLIHSYMANNNGIYYEIYSTNPSYLNSFGFL